ncbi:MAG: A/G-specific adenine glycosylase [Alphaproteobacteria bacterium]
MKKRILLPAKTRQRIQTAIIDWFAGAKRDLPWRNRPTPYRVWVAEIMAQQTQLQTVVPYFARFIKRFPTVAALAAAPIDDVLALWSGLGYYRRARDLHHAAQILMEQHGGKLPRETETLMRLPGIGRYTAGAIASIAYRQPTPVLDGNVIRVLARLFDVADDTNKAATRNRLWELAALLVPADDPRAFNEGLMELGALICTPQSPDCPMCPVVKHCQARRTGTVEQRPFRERKKPPVVAKLHAALVQRDDDAVLLTQNEHDGLYGGLWQVPLFPTAKAKVRNLPQILRERFSVEAQATGKLGRIEHTLSHRRLVIDVYGFIVSGSPAGKTSCRWIKHERELQKLGVSALTRKILNLVGP